MLECVQILVVDDDDRERLLLRTLLSRMGKKFEVKAVRNGCEALEYAKSKQIHILLTDLYMPRMDGVALTKQFLNLYPETVVIWITAYGCHIHKNLMGINVYRCLEKPVEVKDIRLTVKGALSSLQKPGDTI
jgi:DNA-binding NtrC family response regulator